MDIVSYILSTTFTKKSLVGVGALKGAPCTISNITNNPDGTHNITFSWKDNNDITHTSVLTVKDGQTPSISSMPITNGHRLSFTTTNPAQTVTFDVINGANGAQGVSVVSSNVDNYNYLTLTLSNGAIINAGQIKTVANVDNALSPTSSNPVENKVITQALDNKVDKEMGKGLFSDTEKTKLENIEDGAQVNVIEKLIINGQEATVTDKSVALTIITSAVSNLQNYYLKTETYTKQEVEDLIGSTVGVTIEIVQQLPAEGQANIIYFLPTETEGVYSQYIYTTDGWILIGSTTVDLSNYYTKTQVDTLLTGKQNVLTIDSFPTALSNNPVASGGVYSAVASMQPQFQFTNMPVPSASNLGFVYQYIGTSGTYEPNMFYRCVYKSDIGEYQWEEVIFHATVTIDSALSPTSTNPVQNKVVKEALDKKQNAIQFSTLPNAQDYLGGIVQYTGATTASYTNGFFYKSIYDTDTASYIWIPVEFATTIVIDNALSDVSENPVQNKVITGAIEDIQELIPQEASSTNQLVDRDSLGTASQKNFTPYVSPTESGVPISSSVYSAITSAVYGIYNPTGSKTCAELTSDLLIQANVGNVYKVTDDGVTTNLFVGGAGQTIESGDDVIVVYGGSPNTFLFDLRKGDMDLSGFQREELTSPIQVVDIEETTVEGALGALNSKKLNIWIGHKADWDALPTATKKLYDEAHFDDDEPTSANQVTNAVTDGDMRAVTSNAVYDGLETKQNKLTNSSTGVSSYGNKDVVLNNDSINIRNGLHPIDTFPSTLSGQSAQGTTSAYAKALYDYLHERYSDESCVCIGYNFQGEEYTVIVSMAQSGNYGSVVRFGYRNTSAQIIRRESGSWKDNDWVNM